MNIPMQLTQDELDACIDGIEWRIENFAGDEEDNRALLERLAVMRGFETYAKWDTAKRAGQI